MKSRVYTAPAEVFDGSVILKFLLFILILILNSYAYCYSCYFYSVGHGGALVKSMTLNRRIVGSTSALAAT